MANVLICPRCGSARRYNATGGVCPACLLKAAFGDEAALPIDEPL
jgi:NMD protein affecting ribosome stability and mRNA decay